MEKLTDILKKFYSSMESGDPHYIKDIFSQRDDALAIGSDPKEWWYGYESVVYKDDFTIDK